MTTSRQSLPEYAHPPLVAATLGVYYADATMEIEPARLAAFQQRLGPEWAGRWKDAMVEVDTAETDFGLEHWGDQLTNVLGDRVVRVTQDLFAFTWLGTADAHYPRYENVRDGFVAAWDAWAGLNHVPEEQIHTWAVSYLNRIPRGTVWQTPADWTFFELQPQSPSLSARIASAHWEVQTPELDNGLSVSWTIDSSGGDSAVPAIWVKLTATGDVDGAVNFLNGMDAGRGAIVKTFSDLMSPAANAYWGLRRRDA